MLTLSVPATMFDYYPSAPLFNPRLTFGAVPSTKLLSSLIHPLYFDTALAPRSPPAKRRRTREGPYWSEKNDALVLDVPLPSGTTPENIKLEVEDGKLLLTVERNEKTESGHLWRKTQRSFEVPKTADTTNIDAKINKNSRLVISFPKVASQAQEAIEAKPAVPSLEGSSTSTEGSPGASQTPENQAKATATEAETKAEESGVPPADANASATLETEEIAGQFMAGVESSSEDTKVAQPEDIAKAAPAETRIKCRTIVSPTLEATLQEDGSLLVLTLGLPAEFEREDLSVDIEGRLLMFSGRKDGGNGFNTLEFKQAYQLPKDCLDLGQPGNVEAKWDASKHALIVSVRKHAPRHRVTIL